MNRLLLLLSLCVLGACALPGAAPSVTQHDLGGPFPADLKSAVPLRAIHVQAQPTVAGVAMLYREAAQPTRRASYAYNRWAATPASMVEAALVRKFGLEGTARCRLQLSLAEFIIDIDAAGKARALLSADASLYRDNTLLQAQRSFDISVPLAETSPGNGALALRSAVERLAGDSAAWMAGDAGRGCRPG
ncbi:ABC-type transport auxiliary lipoprotein family protein [Uliginosibacterium sediminicola]|uniref:ABC-type transport auxiliary lipoprotein family protein n=1 Tax=Uliginosibacterium sediminicola TaxID=2024550 RepID=A0ABU9YW92_9RHOO